MTNGAFVSRVDWISDTGTEQLTDVQTISLHKSTEIKNNILTVTLKNPSNNLASDGSIIGRYVNPTTKLIKFNEEDELQVNALFTATPSDIEDGSGNTIDWRSSSNILGTFLVEDFQTETSENSTKITLKAIDTAYHLFNKVWTYSYGINNIFTVPGIVRHICRHHTEASSKNKTTVSGTHNDSGTLYIANSKFKSEGGYIEDIRRIRTSINPDAYSIDADTQLDGAINSSVTTITVDSTTGFESDGTLVIGTEHIYYASKSATQFLTCTRGIDDTLAAAHSNNDDVYQGFPNLILNKIWKPLFEWIGELSQTENTNYLAEVQEGGTQYFNRAFMFWIDENNAPHFFYPDDEVDLTVTLGEEDKRGFKLGKSVFDAINFVIYNVGEDMYGNGCLHYWYDTASEVGSLKMRYQPMSKITISLLDEDIKYDATRGTARETTNQDRYKQFVTDVGYPFIPTFMTLANQFRLSELGLTARTNVADDSEYNECLREAAKQVGLVEARKITTKRSGLRYKGQIVLKGQYLQPGDLVQVTNGFTGQNSQLLRVMGVTHQINNNLWELTADVEEDEKISI